MTEQKFEEIVDETLNQIKETLIIKGKEYRRNNNPFHNFDRGSIKTGQLREQVLDGFLLKHLISIDDMVEDIHYNKLPSKETANEKFGDVLIYTILKKASIMDRINVKEHYEKQ